MCVCTVFFVHTQACALKRGVRGHACDTGVRRSAGRVLSYVNRPSYFIWLTLVQRTSGTLFCLNIRVSGSIIQLCMRSFDHSTARALAKKKKKSCHDVLWHIFDAKSYSADSAITARNNLHRGRGHTWVAVPAVKGRKSSVADHVMCFFFFLASWLFCLNSIILDTAITNPAVLTWDPRQETGSATWFHLAFLWALRAGV